MNADSPNFRILIVDDNPSIHADFQRILHPPVAAGELDQEAAALFGGDTGPRVACATFELDSAHQGEEARDKVAAAHAAGRPYALAFVDMRMPPGWDGLVTIGKLWEIDPEINVVICSAYSDHSWEEIQSALPVRERWLALKKPFDKIEVLQLAHALTEKWRLNRLASTQQATLARMVEERTGELRHALQVKNEFLANITHELLTPMNGVIGMLQLIAEGSITPDRENLEVALRSGEGLLQRLQQILVFNRAEAGTLSTKPSSCDLVVTAEEVLAAHRARAAKKGLKLAADLAAGTPRQVTASVAVIRQILFVLLDNAVNFTTEGSVALEIGRQEDRLVFTVADTGIGLSPEQLEWIAVPFAQIDGGRNRRGTGFGLGLPLAKRLAASLGAELVFRTRPHQGTHISFSAPAKFADATPGP